MDEMNEFRHEMRRQLTSILNLLCGSFADPTEESSARLLPLPRGAPTNVRKFGLGFPLIPGSTKKNHTDPTEETNRAKLIKLA